MGDTHSNSGLFHAVADLLVESFGAEVILHTGDSCSDAKELAMAGHTVRMVPGFGCSEYSDGSVPRRFLEEFARVTVACAHSEDILRWRERRAALIVTGHTHRASIDLVGRSLFVNPGHLKQGIDRGQRSSFAVITIGPDAVKVALREADGALRREESVSLDRIG